jgi:hypothetical protein
MRYLFSITSATLLVAVLTITSTAVAEAPKEEPTRVGALSATPFAVSDALQQALDDTLADCAGCFASIAPWRLSRIAAPADVFSSATLLDVLLAADTQLPWAARGEVDPQALALRLGSATLVDAIAAEADPAGGGYRLGAYRWSHPTAPDYCSGETLYLLYFPRTAVLFAFRFDSSSEC